MSFFKTTRVIVSAWAILALTVPATSRALDLSAYQRADGAITVHAHGNRVDPYFAIKALWAARQLGDPAPAETKAWINWLLPRQKDDGSFARYCEQPSGWQSCEELDADDSLLAMWIELLYEAAPRNMPPQWAVSVQRAEHALQLLLEQKTGVYRAGPSINDALLMDNTEVYAALRRIGDLQRLAGDKKGSEHHFAQAHALRLAMANVFQPHGKELLRWSSGDDSSNTFYPYALAHLYPWLHGMNTERFGNMMRWQNWLENYGDEWLSRSGDSYPWGLVALLAVKQGSYSVVQRWLDNAVALRGTAHWNVLEEATMQELARARLKGTWK